MTTNVQNRGKPGLFPSMGMAGFTALIAVNFTHPIEVVKTRLQVEGTFSATTFLKEEGAFALWKGIQSAWLREASYTSIKLGGYGPIRKLYGAESPDAPFILKFAAGSTSGCLGSVVGNPFDVCKTMMMAESKTKVSLLELMRRMLKEQGIGGFYRGMSANMARATVLNGTKMACYDKIKGIVTDKTGWGRKDPRGQFVSAIGAGFFMTCTVSPFDMLRTTLMNQPTDRQIYKGFADAAVQIFKEKGPFAFYRGFFPIWGRFAPQATLQLIIFEQVLKISGYEAL
jgi:hypothetical protein